MDKFKLNQLPEIALPVSPERAQHDKAAEDLSHDAIHCSWCSHDRKMLQIGITAVGLSQASLQATKDANGVPRGTIWAWSQITPTQNQNYTSTPAPFDGVVRNLALSGSGNITITLISNFIPGGSLLIGTFNTPFNIAHHILVPVGSTFKVSTDGAAAAFIATSAWLEPATMDDSDFYRFRR